MRSDHSRRFTRPRRARRTGLICLPGTLAIELDAEYPEVPRRSIDEWLELPPAQRAPRAAIAMYELARGKVRIAIIDAQAQALHSIIEGPRRALPRVMAALSELAGAARPPVDLLQAQLDDVKPDGTTPPGGPNAAPPIAFAVAGARTIKSTDLRGDGVKLADIKGDGSTPTGGPNAVEPVTLVA